LSICLRFQEDWIVFMVLVFIAIFLFYDVCMVEAVVEYLHDFTRTLGIESFALLA
jgi:hypothetical protein